MISKTDGIVVHHIQRSADDRTAGQIGHGGALVQVSAIQKKNVIVFSRSTGFVDQMRNIRKTILKGFLLAG